MYQETYVTVSDLRILYRRPFKKYVTYELMEEVVEKSDEKMRQRQRVQPEKWCHSPKSFLCPVFYNSIFTVLYLIKLW